LSDLTYPAFKRSEKIFPSLEDFQNDKGNFHTVNHYGYQLPGFYDKIHEWCGLWKTKGCLNIDKHTSGKAWIKRYQRSCYRADCNTCYQKWLARLANRSSTRFTIYEAYFKKVKAKHLVVSPPEYQHYLPLKKLRKLAYKYLKSVGCIGGTLIFHPFRNKDKVWRYSPHFHVIGYGWILRTKELSRKDGWIIKNLGIRKSIFWTLYYQLSHCGVMKGKHTLTWFGELGYSNSILKVELDNTPEQCPFCYAQLVELEFTGRGEPPPDENFEGFYDPVSFFAPEVPKFIRGST